MERQNRSLHQRVMSSKGTFIGLQMVDIASTAVGNRMFGVQKYEYNPLGVFAYEHGGVLGLLAAKAIGLAIFFTLVSRMESSEKRRRGDDKKFPQSKKFLMGINYLYGVIDIMNIVPLFDPSVFSS